jgi:ATP-binding cassette subfamily B protein
MALALFVATPISFAIILLSRKLQERLGEKHVASKLAASEAVQEYLEGIKVVKAFGLTGEKSEALEASLKEMKSKAMKFEWITGTFITLASTILNAAIGLVVLVGAQLLSAGEIEPIKVLCFAMIAMRINAPFMTVLTLLPEFFYMLISTKRMRELRQIAPMEGDEKIELENLDIEFDGVSFAYNEDDVIKDLSVKIPQGRVTAFVGPSGSGKTTLFRLIARFWDVSSGKILIGGKDVRGIDPERLMSYMSFVFQDVVLFNDTVMNNIRIGRRGASDKEIFASAKMARCDGFISEMPEGYQTLIGENGQTLSGGERQRISIARALLKDAPVVLLDEATASLDPENETEIQAAISALASGRTVIVIAHRLRTVMGADKIIVLEGGRIVEEGRSAELLRAGGVFARLYKIQQESLGWSI